MGNIWRRDGKGGREESQAAWVVRPELPRGTGARGCSSEAFCVCTRVCLSVPHVHTCLCTWLCVSAYLVVQVFVPWPV